MMSRERRSWTEEEDQLLRNAVDLEEPGTMSPSKWHAIAKHVPSRTNKDCRKRWFAKMASDVVKGGWAPEEDEKLVQAIEKYGTRWSLVSAHVQSRNSDQCAKRWTDTLNPMIDRTRWSAEADALLLKAVQEHGKLWTKIVRIYFPGRTGLSAKNRYNSITRFSTRAPRRKACKPRARSQSTSSTVSRSPSVSPISPSVSSTSDISELPRTPPSFELDAPSISDPSSQSAGMSSDVTIDPATWSTPDLLGSHSVSPTFTYEELCSALLSSTGLPADQSLNLLWVNTYSQLHSGLDHVCTDSTLPPTSHSVESFDSSFLPFSNLNSPNPTFDPTALSPDSNALPASYPSTEDTGSVLGDTSQVSQTDYTFPVQTSFWELPTDPHSSDSLSQWSRTY